MSIRVEAISVSGAGAAVSGASLAWRRAALWGLVAAKVLASWGVQWDIQWHTIIGRDSFWIAPHLMTYSGVTLTVLLSFGALTFTTLRPSRAAGDVVRALGFVGTRGFHLAAWGIALTVLSGSRWAPAAVLVGAVALGLVGQQLARLGFDLLQPVSVIEAEIAKDPTSPIAVANIVARRNGTVPGATTSVAQLLGLIPIAAMVAVDPRQRPVAASTTYAVALFGPIVWRLGSL